MERISFYLWNFWRHHHWIAGGYAWFWITTLFLVIWYYIMCAKNETCIILNIWYKSIAMKFSMWHPDGHTLTCHLTFVMFLHYLTLHKNWNATLMSWSIDTWDHIPQGIIDKAIDQWQRQLCACVKEKGRHFEHLQWSSHTSSSFQNHSLYWDEDNISFRFLLDWQN